MELLELQDWVRQFYSSRGWKDYGPFIRVGFLMEEVGEAARAVRAYEIGRDHPNEPEQTKAVLRQDLMEELGDVVANVAVLADLYHISLDDIARAHQQKLSKRFDGE